MEEYFESFWEAFFEALADIFLDFTPSFQTVAILFWFIGILMLVIGGFAFYTHTNVDLLKLVPSSW
ncbi:hypothetical protein [Bacillus xiapuensis]|uniref:Uncharacterized protein n=1 Tax=Bacillus xiapuensis TaxID=2014075 RepID=A0ABU6N4P6_9BACI|nr:hypothetical protein [Bacillus xiapuensis]